MSYANAVVYTKSEILNTVANLVEQHGMNSVIVCVKNHPVDPDKIIAIWDEREGGPGVFQLSINGNLNESDGWMPVPGFIRVPLELRVGETEPRYGIGLLYVRYAGVYVGNSLSATEEPYSGE